MLKKVRNDFLYVSNNRNGSVNVKNVNSESKRPATRLVIEEDTIYEIDMECEECSKKRKEF